MTNMKTDELQVVFGDGTLGVTQGVVKYLFSYERGGLESLNVSGREWLYRVPKPAFWRATTDNDRGNKFSEKSAQWLGADQFSFVSNIRVALDGVDVPFIAPDNNVYGSKETADHLEITFEYQTPTSPVAKAEVTYDIDHAKGLSLSGIFHGQSVLPELPAFGIRFELTELADGFVYDGLSGETYPDRFKGGEQGIYQVIGLPVTPYLVPQENGMHIDSNWVAINSEKLGVLRFGKSEEQFAFSALPYTAVELESATHLEELPAPRRTVLTIYGAVRGVGGIDSWGSDVQPDYRLPADKDYQVSVTIRPTI